MEKPQKEIESIDVEHLVFDPKNPRLPSGIDGNNEKEVIGWMLQDATIVELISAIGEQGYFLGEPLLVVPNGKNFTVVEGNRRLCAVNLLLKPQLAPSRKKAVQEASDKAKYKPKSLPVIKYKKREEILEYLGYRHITGIKPWDPLAKARYLKQLMTSIKERTLDRKLAALAREIGSHADYVARLLTGLALYEEIEENAFYRINELSEETIDFSLITTALNYATIPNFLGLKSVTNPDLSGLKKANLKEFTSWMFEKVLEGKTRLGESRNIKLLSKVVAKDEALTAFRNGNSLQDAVLLTEEPSDIFSTSIRDSKTRLLDAKQHSHKVDSPKQTDMDNLDEIDELAKELHLTVKEKLHRKR